VLLICTGAAARKRLFARLVERRRSSLLGIIKNVILQRKLGEKFGNQETSVTFVFNSLSFFFSNN